MDDENFLGLIVFDVLWERIFFIAYFLVSPEISMWIFQFVQGGLSMDKALKAAELPFHLVHLYQELGQQRSHQQRLPKKECLPWHHLQDIASMSRSKRTAINELWQKSQCNKLMREESFLHYLWKHKTPLRMLSKMVWSVLFWHQDHQQNHLLHQNHNHPNKPQLKYLTTAPSWHKWQNTKLTLACANPKPWKKQQQYTPLNRASPARVSMKAITWETYFSKPTNLVVRTVTFWYWQWLQW